ncbi:MAG: TonB-dependent receptor family protein [Bacteroidales bacterium]|nr:TonB-dependent receptor family protein [Bacteroidales bacterium]
MKAYKYGLLVCCVVSCVCLANAQTTDKYEIRGRVVDSRNGDLVQYANCMLLNSVDSAFVTGLTCDVQGVFVFSKMESGDYLLVIRRLGYEQLYVSLGIKGDVNLGDVAIHRSTEVLEKVTVSADKPVYSDDGEKTYYYVKDDPVVQTGTMADALQNAPGVEVDAQGKITFRGSEDIAVFINNKPAKFDEESLRQFIKTLPANNIERIEVMENPSARYDAKGSIVNIITRKSFSMNQLICVGINASDAPRLSPWASYVWANEKVSLNVYMNGAFHHGSYYDDHAKSFYTADSLLSAEESYMSNIKQRYNDQYLGVNLDYVVNEKNLLSAHINSVRNYQHNTSEYDVTHWEHIFNAGDYSYSNITDETQSNISGSVDLEWTHFDSTGRKMNIALSSSNYGNSVENEYTRDYQLSLPSLGLRECNSNKGSTTSLTVDYFWPYSKTGNIETGFEVDFKNINTVCEWDSVNQMANTSIRDAVRSYSSVLNDNDIQQYITVQQRFGKFNLKAGVRLYENWKSKQFDNLYIETTEFDVDRFYFNILPTFSANYRTAKNHNFNLSYAYRFGRPGASTLSLYKTIDVESYSVGNPSLGVNNTHTLNLGWSFYKKWGSVGLSAYHWQQTNSMKHVSDVSYLPFFNRIVEYTTYVDGGESRNTGLQLNMMIRPAAFATIRFNASVYDSYYKLQYRPDLWTENESINYFMRVNAQFKLWKFLQVFANAVYTGKKYDFMSYTNPVFYMDGGLSAELLDRRLSLYVNVSDMFNTRKYKTVSTNVFLSSQREYYYDSRHITIGATWRIGKMDLAGKAVQGSKD